METVEKSKFNFAKWLMVLFISTSVLSFIISMILEPKTDGDNKIFGFLMSYSIIGFLIGMFFFVANMVNWVSAAGFALFIVLMILGIVLANSEDYGAIGGLSFPFSMVIFGLWIYWFNIGAKNSKNKQLLKTGIKAKGILVGYKANGIEITTNANFPKYGMELIIDVQINGKTIFQTKANEMLTETEIFHLKEGMALSIKYKPDNTELIAVESWSAII
jgi:hypothetical protein